MINMKSVLFFVMLFWVAGATLEAGGKKQVAPAEAEVLEIPVEHPSPWYIGGGPMRVHFLKDPCSPFDPHCRYEDTTFGIMMRGGYDMDPYFGIEGRAAYSFLDKGPYGGAPIAHIGLYLKPQYPLTERFNLYGLLGFGYTKNLGSGARLNYFDHDTGFAAGAGIEYDLSDADGDRDDNLVYDRAFDGYADQGMGWVLFLDFQRLLIKSGTPDMDMLSLGLRYDF